MMIRPGLMLWYFGVMFAAFWFCGPLGGLFVFLGGIDLNRGGRGYHIDSEAGLLLFVQAIS